MKQIKESAGRLGGRGLALAGTITSAIALLLVPIAFLAAMLLPALAKAKSKAQTINCVNNVKQLGLGARLYSSDNNDVYPSGTNWCDALNQYVGMPKVYQCPADLAQLRSGYAFNAKLSGLAEKDVDPLTVMIFESDSGWNASGGKELMITQPRHGGRFVVGLADGSVQQFSAAQLQQLRWDPKPGASNNQ
jgi:prepilin-type processing-associated H-X9-DG protein